MADIEFLITVHSECDKTLDRKTNEQQIKILKFRISGFNPGLWQTDSDRLIVMMATM